MRSVSNNLSSKQLISSLKCAEQFGESTKHTQTYRLSGAPNTLAPARLAIIEHMLAIPFTPDEPSTQVSILPLLTLLFVSLRELLKSPLHVPPMLATQDLHRTSI